MLARGDRDLRRPPVPAQPVEAARHRLAEAPQRHRRQRRLVRRIGRIARQAGNAHVVVVDGVPGLEGRIADRPVVGHAVEAADPEVGRMQPREVRGVQDRPATDPVEVQDRDRRMLVVDRIVFRAPPHVRVRREIRLGAQFPVAPGGRVVRRLDPVPLVEAQDAHPGVGHAPRERGARGTGADDQDVDGIVHHSGIDDTQEEAPGPCDQPGAARAAMPRARSASSICGHSAGFVRCTSKPASAVRWRSRAVPQPVTAAMRAER